MPIISPLPIRLVPGAVARALHIPPADSETVNELLAFAQPLLHPRALFRDAFIDRRRDDAVEIEVYLFRSRVLSLNLKGTERVFPFLITVGGELEAEASKQNDLLRQYYLETIADLALHAAGEFLEAHIQRTFGLEKISSMSPGSLEDWPLDEQKPLFALLGETENRLGVRLTDSLLMVPRKSVSGILFPAEESFASCSLCPRSRCQGRRAPFDPDRRRAFGLEDGIR
jgi:hypothetical protein